MCGYRYQVLSTQRVCVYWTYLAGERGIAAEVTTDGGPPRVGVTEVHEQELRLRLRLTDRTSTISTSTSASAAHAHAQLRESLLHF